MRLYENCYSDINALNDDTISELRNYHEETRSLIKYYYLDIPHDVCKGIKEFENKHIANLLGRKWRRYLSDRYAEFREGFNTSSKTAENVLKGLTELAYGKEK